MATQDEIYREIMNIKKDVEAVKDQTSWLLRGQAGAVANHWQDYFGIKTGKKRHFGKMRVFLETNGKRTIKEIAEAAKVHQPDASAWLIEMERERLVIKLPETRGRKIYQKTQADFALGISDALQEEMEKKCSNEKEKK